MSTADSITRSATEPLGEYPPSLSLPASALATLHGEAGAADLGLNTEDFAVILGHIAAKYLPREASEADAAAFCRGLRLAELALARACAAGNEKAWNQFLTRYREGLYGAALAMVGDAGSAREMADSVYADLYGLNERAGRRVSKLAYYDGRGSLEGWLRSVLAHEFTNRWRSGRRLVSLDEQVEAGGEFRAPEPAAASAPDPRLEAATAEALESLSAEERFLLASYYLDGQTLAEIGAVLSVHESTVSRRLDRMAGALSKRILKGLRRRGLSRDQAREALEADVRDLAVDVSRHLRANDARKEPGAVLNTGEE
ncbi:MAG TPA: sigma-70 family RNA polymerase sigma factor [Terriglobia bacterium]|nr:sigma-70 family RNA polymerase sigma factor [Terriglobia bacterium]